MGLSCAGGHSSCPTWGQAQRRPWENVGLGGPVSEFCSTTDIDWALLTLGGTVPATTWPCPGPRGSRWTWEELAHGRERAGEQ